MVLGDGHRCCQVLGPVVPDPVCRPRWDRRQELLQEDLLHQLAAFLPRLQPARRRLSESLTQRELEEDPRSRCGQSPRDRRQRRGGTQQVRGEPEGRRRLSAALCASPVSSGSNLTPHSSFGHAHVSDVATKISKKAWGSSFSTMPCMATAADADRFQLLVAGRCYRREHARKSRQWVGLSCLKWSGHVGRQIVEQHHAKLRYQLHDAKSHPSQHHGWHHDWHPSQHHGWHPLQHQFHHAKTHHAELRYQLHHAVLRYQLHDELEKWRSPEFYEREVHRMQLPFSGKLPGGCVSAEERQERRAQQLRRLQEINARRRGEKLQQDQERLDRLMAVQELLEDGLLDQFHRSLQELNMDSAEELQSYINKLQQAVEQSRHKLLHSDTAEAKTEASELEEGDNMYADFPEDTLPEKAAHVLQPAFNMAEYHQLFVGTERLRCPEILFQPSLTGEDQMGLMETLQYVLARYTPEQQEALVSNVFLTGGNMQYPGMKERMERELLAIRPFQSHFKVTMATRPALDAWLGARDWALEHPPGGGGEGWISRQDYEEKGGEYLSEHCASNVSVPIKVNKNVPARPVEAPVTMVASDVAMVTSTL
ncbi:actin-related protein 5 [Entelurus aequoreus]|uniref:actin-related protein 5 n=1 Tax=Entelurus aequoreus TaxID=161455 RepID=UPI002B1DE724|nr:actin-related protein 5 [Entelurus aequoreus]